MISQADAARLIAAHERVVKFMSNHPVYETDGNFLKRMERLGDAERAFAELVAQLTDSEGL